jgi:hypothetical protein
MLALHVEGDLPAAATAATSSHLAACEECRRVLEELHASQAFMKSVLRETVSTPDCSAMRRAVMAIINERPGTLGWRFRIERAFVLGLRPSFGLAAFLLLGMVSASVLAQMRPVETLLLPEGYRHWTSVGDRVYVDPSSYQEFEKTGVFPEGTVLVWDAGSAGSVSRGNPHPTSSTLLVSIKDSSKFVGGWGFFDFSGGGRPPSAKAHVLPESKGCRSCHRQSPLSLGA